MISKLLAKLALPIIGALFFALVGASGWIWLQAGWLDDLETQNARLTSDLATCSARVRNIREDQEDDATVGHPGDFPVPDNWLLPED